MPFEHFPVMLDEVVQYLDCGPGKTIVDGTLGGSGHAKAILEKVLPGGKLVGIDQDLDAFHNAESVLKEYSPAIHLFHDNFIHLQDILSRLNISAVGGILLDLGLSLHQLEKSGRGFSFSREEPLDMRMNINTETTAGDIVNTLSEKALADIFKKYGEERWSRRIAGRIVRERHRRSITTSTRLADIIRAAIPKRGGKPSKIDPATRVFMSLRIAVNRELERLAEFLGTVPDLLNPGGRLCVLSFHSLEDRIVKYRIREFASDCVCPPGLPQCGCGKKAVMKPVVKKAIKPSRKEIDDNPKSRSALLRVAEKL